MSAYFSDLSYQSLAKQIGMRASGHQSQRVGVIKVIDQEPVGLDMTLPEARPLSDQLMRAATFG